MGQARGTKGDLSPQRVKVSSMFRAGAAAELTLGIQISRLLFKLEP